MTISRQYLCTQSQESSLVRSKGSPKYSEMWVAKGKHNLRLLSEIKTCTPHLHVQILLYLLYVEVVEAAQTCLIMLESCLQVPVVLPRNTSQCGKWLQQVVEFKLLVKKAPKRGLSGQVRNAWHAGFSVMRPNPYQIVILWHIIRDLKMCTQPPPSLSGLVLPCRPVTIPRSISSSISVA